MRIVGHGIDIVEVARIERMMSDHADRFLERCFTPAERAVGEGGRRYAEHIAARFAAKEAAMKALGTGLTSGIAWTDIGVENAPTGEPRLIVVGRAAEIASQRGVAEWWVSLSHSDTMAVASVMAVGR
jgi:holo-[acyl-carrier protein] synthase